MKTPSTDERDPNGIKTYSTKLSGNLGGLGKLVALEFVDYCGGKVKVNDISQLIKHVTCSFETV